MDIAGLATLRWHVTGSSLELKQSNEKSGVLVLSFLLLTLTCNIATEVLLLEIA